MPGFLKRFGRGAVAGGEGATAGLLQNLLMQREQERYEGEQAEELKTSNLQRLLMQARIGEIQQEELEKPLSEGQIKGAVLQEFLQDPEFREEYKSGLLRKLQPKGEAGKVIGGEKGGFHYFDPETGKVEKIVPGRPTRQKPALDPKDIMGMLFNLETQARTEDSPFFGMDVDSAFTELATKAGVPLPGRAKPQRSTIMDEIMRGGEQGRAQTLNPDEQDLLVQIRRNPQLIDSTDWEAVQRENPDMDVQRILEMARE